MKKVFLFTAIAAVTALGAHAQDLAGDWQGTLKAGPSELRLLVHISKTENGAWQGTLDSVDQGALGMKIASVKLKDSKVSFTVPSVRGLYDGKLNAAGTVIEGVWSQGQPLPLNLQRLIPAPKTSDQPANSSDIEGSWLGNLQAGSASLRTILHIAKSDRGIVATLDSPDQGANGIPATAVTRTGSTLKVEFKQLGAAFEGAIYKNPPSIAGAWKQSGNSLPLTLNRVADASALERRRPQNPVKPYPYREEEVSYQNKGAGITLGGTLTTPQGKGPFPAVVLITGSGQQDRDESLLGHKPFLVLADYLTRKGIAVLRSDDRGMGKSGGDFEKSTTADFAGDAEAAFAYLQTRQEIDQKKMGFIGHSEGGIIAPMIAARNSNVAFIVTMAGPGVRGDELLPVQVTRLAQASGASQEDANRAGASEREVLALVTRSKDSAALEKGLREMMSGTVPATQIDAQIKTQGRMLGSPWFRYFLTFDPAEALRKVKCPVLAINGEKDTQVDAVQNLVAIRKALEAGGNQKFEVVEFPGLNHLFQTAKTGAPSEYGDIEETIAPVALEKMSSWILNQR